MEATTQPGPDGGAVVGVDLGGTKLVATLYGGDGAELASERVLVAGHTGDRLLTTLAETVTALARRSSEPVVAAGYGVPCTVDQRTGTAVVAANLPLRDVPLRDELERRTGVPAFIDNDANVAALAEQRQGAGAGVDGGRAARHLIMITLGTGLGGGVVVDGRILRGATGAAGELGHVTIAHQGRPCTAPNCANVGCAEAYASGTALARDTREFVDGQPSSPLARAIAGGAEANGETVVRMATGGDDDSVRLLETAGEGLGALLVSLVNTFDPEIVCVGGGMTPALRWMLPVATRRVRERAMPPANAAVRIVPASFGAAAGVLGAALMARDGLRERESAGGAGTRR